VYVVAGCGEAVSFWYVPVLDVARKTSYPVAFAAAAHASNTVPPETVAVRPVGVAGRWVRFQLAVAAPTSVPAWSVPDPPDPQAFRADTTPHRTTKCVARIELSLLSQAPCTVNAG
jgi:hypothetical protein